MTKPERINLSMETQKLIDELIKKMTLDEKCSLLAGKNNWATVSIPRLGIESMTLTDGPHGVRPDGGYAGRKMGKATYFPTGVAMAATWNTDLIYDIGQALGEETRAYGCDILLGPCVNIIRTPLAGRNFESMSEDPFVAGRIAAAWIDGIQSQGVGASLKHFACNNQETERIRGSSEIDERTLREIYLAQFEYAVKVSQPWTVMCSYNRINGVYACQNEFMLTKVLRQEWGFQGTVVSDWGANHAVFESVAAGLDLEMPGPAKYFKLLPDAVALWQISESTVDKAVRRILELLAKTGHLGKNGKIISGSANTKAHQQLARKAASEAITLLKNDRSVLPLNPQKIKTVAIFGLGAVITPQGGGSSTVPSPYRIAALDAIKTLVGKDVDVKYHNGYSGAGIVDLVDVNLLKTPDGKNNGLYAEYFAGTEFNEKPLGTRIETVSDLWWYGDDDARPVKGLPFESFSGRLTAKITVVESGIFNFGVDIQGTGRMLVDGNQVFETHPFQEGANWGTGNANLQMNKGQEYILSIEFIKSPADQPMHVKLFSKEVFSSEPTDVPRQLAAGCDAAIVFVGYPDGHECEGGDRQDMTLPAEQNQLVELVNDANPHTIVVLNTGVPVEMPWSDRVQTILQAYYPGQEGGNAIADIIFGKVNPSGRLAISYPKRFQDNPAYLHFPGNREVHYGEGIFVGYRYYDTKGVEPLFPFGHGLSYTEFEYSKLRLQKQATINDNIKVKLTVKNIGKVIGKEVVQLYVSDLESSVARPEKELKGFVKVELKPTESRELEFILDTRAFAFYDVVEHNWKVEPGEFAVMVGSSSRDIRLKGKIVLK